MNADDVALRELIINQPVPVCGRLTPFEIVEINSETGYVRLEFAPQPAFENHFGNIQGGFAVAMLDVVLSIAAFTKSRQWLPTVEIKASFVAPAKIGRCMGEGFVLRAGRSVIFVEGKLSNEDGSLAVHATATVVGAGTSKS